jgi:hypothetical protein
VARQIGANWRKKIPLSARLSRLFVWLRGLDLNQRPSGYEPDELPGCSTPRQNAKRGALPARFEGYVATVDRNGKGAKRGIS